MKILFVSNYYPPRTVGGYEQWCQETAVELARRGHQLSVLTSTGRGTPDDAGNVDVRRVLHLEVESGLLTSTVRQLGERRHQERENLDHVRGSIGELNPDVVLIWGMWNVPRSVPALIEQLQGNRVAFYFCDYWPTLPSAHVQQWEAPARHGLNSFTKRMLAGLVARRLRRWPVQPLRLANPVCVSEAVRDGLTRAGLPVRHARIVYGGTHLEAFVPSPPRERRPGCLRLLYAGRLTATKGIHTAVTALDRVNATDVTLDVIGAGEPEYEQALRRQVGRLGLRKRVRFLGSVLPAAVPGVLARYDALLVPSEWDEPFARTVLEGLAAGLVVIGSTAGGTPEILVEDETGLTFPPGDATALACQIQRLADEPLLQLRLAQAGRRCVEQHFSFPRMVDELEQALAALAFQSAKANN